MFRASSAKFNNFNWNRKLLDSANPNWSKFYANGPEILKSIEETCDKWDLRRDIEFNTRVTKLEWLEEDRITLTVEPRAFDMLLDQRPWSISIVKLPWMPLPLYVTWR